MNCGDGKLSLSWRICCPALRYKNCNKSTQVITNYSLNYPKCLGKGLPFHSSFFLLPFYIQKILSSSFCRRRPSSQLDENFFSLWTESELRMGRTWTLLEMPSPWTSSTGVGQIQMAETTNALEEATMYWPFLTGNATCFIPKLKLFVSLNTFRENVWWYYSMEMENQCCYKGWARIYLRVLHI